MTWQAQESVMAVVDMAQPVPSLAVADGNQSEAMLTERALGYTLLAPVVQGLVPYQLGVLRG